MSFLHNLNSRLRPAEVVLAPVVGKIARTLVAEATGSDKPLDDDALDATAKALCDRMASMPRFLGLPMMGATVFFDLCGVAVAGRPFRFQSSAQRQLPGPGCRRTTQRRGRDRRAHRKGPPRAPEPEDGRCRWAIVPQPLPRPRPQLGHQPDRARAHHRPHPPAARALCPPWLAHAGRPLVRAAIRGRHGSSALPARLAAGATEGSTGNALRDRSAGARRAGGVGDAGVAASRGTRGWFEGASRPGPFHSYVFRIVFMRTIRLTYAARRGQSSPSSKLDWSSPWHRLERRPSLAWPVPAVERPRSRRRSCRTP